MEDVPTIGLPSLPYQDLWYIAFRVYGQNVRHGVIILQSIQLLFNVGVIIVLNGQSLSQSGLRTQLGPKRRVLHCSLLCVGHLRNVTWADPNLSKAGASGEFRHLVERHHHHFNDGCHRAHISKYTAAKTAYMVDHGAVVTTAGLSEGVAFQGQVVGLMQAVYS